MIDLLALLLLVAVLACVLLVFVPWPRRPRLLRIALHVVVAGIAGVVGAWKLSNARTVQLFGEIVPRVERSDRVVALTFDDGPTPEGAEAVLAILRERDVRATFFLNGRDIEQHLETTQRIVDAGHEQCQAVLERAPWSRRL